MWPYWLLFFVTTYFAITLLKPAEKISLKNKWTSSWLSIYILLILMIGLRHEVGGDWRQYLELLESYKDTSSASKFGFQDPAFVLLNQIAAWSGGGIYLLNFLSAMIFTWGVISFCHAQPRPWLALVVAVPYLITVVGMGYTRQGVAIGIAMVAMVALGYGRTFRFVAWIIIASLFHKSAIILVPMAALAGAKRKAFKFVWVGISCIILYLLLLQETLSFWQLGYIESEYQSSGAAIRIIMSAVPALILLIFKKRFALSANLQSFWSLMAWTALILVVFLILTPSTTAIDRIALYWIPLQLFVLSRIPNSIGRPNSKNAIWVFAVVAYSATIHFVWLVYADTVHAWLPYQFYPWVMLWR